MPIFKRKRIQADNFKAQSDDPNDPAIALDFNSTMGFYKKDDNTIAAAINNVDRFKMKKDAVVLPLLNSTDSGENNSIFISGSSLQFRDNLGAIRRLDA